MQEIEHLPKFHMNFNKIIIINLVIKLGSTAQRFQQKKEKELRGEFSFQLISFNYT